MKIQKSTAIRFRQWRSGSSFICNKFGDLRSATSLSMEEIYVLAWTIASVKNATT